MLGMQGHVGPAWATAPGLPSIRLVVPFFGPLPPHLPLVLRSMAANPDVSWLLMTDQRVTGAPPNVTVQMWSFEDLVTRIRDFFDFEVSLEEPYKLCDFRPAFGAIFAEELAGYDFWGHCDLDLIFGRIRDHLPAVAFEADKVLFNGNFSLYRNTEADGRLVPPRGGQGQLPGRIVEPGGHALRRVGRHLLHRRGPRCAQLARERHLRHLLPPVPHPRGADRGPRARSVTPGRTGKCASTGWRGVAWCAAPRC